MTKTFLISDTHFGHAGICKFLRDDGTKIRPWDDPEEMNLAMIEAWNGVVGPNDKVYHLGDVVLNRRFLSVLELLNGRKVLIRGNHDIFKLRDYAPHFEDVIGVGYLDGLYLTHVPVHPGTFSPRIRGNIHGHLHWRTVDDPRYFNCCVECIDYTPVDFEAIRAHFASLNDG